MIRKYAQLNKDGFMVPPQFRSKECPEFRPNPKILQNRQVKTESRLKRNFGYKFRPRTRFEDHTRGKQNAHLCS